MNNIADRIREYSRLYEIRRQLTKQVEELASKMYKLEISIAEDMDDEGMEQARVDGVSVTLNKRLMPQVVDHDKFVRWCAEFDRTDMVHRRCSARAFEEYMEQHGGNTPPGTQATPVKKLNYRNTGK